MSSGERSYWGYEYQIYVTSLILIKEYLKPGFQELIIESKFGNDAEIVTGEQTDILVTWSIVTTDSSTVKVQIKTKDRNYQWQPAEFRDILLKSDESQSAESTATILSSLIRNPDQTFLFITDGILSPKLVGLRSRNSNMAESDAKTIRDALVGSCRKDTDLKEELKRDLTREVLSRVSIVDNLEHEALKLQLRSILAEQYGTPYYRTEEVIAQLQGLVRKTMLRTEGSDRIKASELQPIIGRYCCGAIYPELDERFIATDSFERAKTILQNSHIVILSGEPCVGKTTTAWALVKKCSECNCEPTFPRYDEAHLEIARAASGKQDRVFLLDDYFGDIQRSTSTVQGNQFASLVKNVSSASGRIKVVITARTNVISETISSTRLLYTDIEPFQVTIPLSNDELKQDIFERLIELHQPPKQELISAVNNVVEMRAFEDLLHVSQFAHEILKIDEIDQANILRAFDSTRPSAYQVWFRQQPDDCRLLLYTIAAIIDSNQFAWEAETKRIFQIACSCLGLQPTPGFGDTFARCIGELLERQARINRLPNRSFNLVHPKFRDAVSTNLRSEPGAAEFVLQLIERLIEVPEPIEQSVAVGLCIRYQPLIVSQFTGLIRRLAKSPYVQARETIIRYGGVGESQLLESELPEDDNGASLIALLLVEAKDCMIDEFGHLVVKEREPLQLVNSADVDQEMVNIQDLKRGAIDLGRQNTFIHLFETGDFQSLNTLQKHDFGLWLAGYVTRSNLLVPFNLVRNLANDQISFVRKNAAAFLDPQTMAADQQYDQLFRDLCYDAHPYVKIAVLEKVILEYWRKVTPAVQEQWLEIVSDMLDDAVVRNSRGKGLINQSGTFYSYHAEHSPEQIDQWFCALAPRLLKYRFDTDDFDRFLTAYDQRFSRLPSSLRTSLLRAITQYVQTYGDTSGDVLYTVEQIVLSESPTDEERDIVLELIQKYPSWGRARLCYSFAKHFSELDDPRFRNFVHRPFYAETEMDYLAERAAAILGYLANSQLTFDELPLPIRRTEASSAYGALSDYILKSENSLKLLLVFMAHQYGHTNHLSTVSDKAFEHPIVQELVTYFASQDPETAIRVVDLLLDSLDFISPELNKETIPIVESNWYQMFQMYLYDDRAEVGKRICDIVFALNLANSVHNYRIFASLLHLLLTHPNEEVSEHAFALFDKHYFSVMELIFNRELPASWRAEIDALWWSPGFLSMLFKRSVAFKQWISMLDMANSFSDNWRHLSELNRDRAIDTILGKIDPNFFELMVLAEKFYLKMEDTLNSEQVQRMKTMLYEEKRYGTSLRGRIELNNRKLDLDDLIPKTDWSQYFPE